MEYLVSKNGTSYETIASALREAQKLPEGEEAVIRISAGEYRENLEITRGNLTLIGEGPDSTVIAGSLAAVEILPDGEKRGTFRTQTIYIHADNITFENLSVINDAGDGAIAGQALALYNDGDNLHFKNCVFDGFQDTIFEAPLPLAEVHPGGFRGPGEFLPRVPGKRLYEDCCISGTVDFIFGGGEAEFRNCEIYSKYMAPKEVPGKDGDVGGTLAERFGYVTAASTPEGQEKGFTFIGCRFVGDAKAGSVYLGRPWRDYATVHIENCFLGDHIHPAHWHDWSKPAAHKTARYTEHGNFGPGDSDDIAPFAKKI